MNKKLLISLVVFLLCCGANAQVSSCGGGRYYDDVFQNVTVYSGLVYGQALNVNGQNQTLKLDFYKPTGDTITKRPLILLAFGGSFVFGLRTSPDIVQLCNAFAKKGYVCASIDYRLGLSPGGLNITADNVKKAIWRVTHDMRAAVRWMHMNADVDSLGVDTTHIIVGGVSAGGFGALHCAYLDKESEIPTVMDTATEGGVEGNSGNPGYSSRPWAVINLCGALLDTSWMQADDPPVVTLQGDKDGSVPYCTDVEEVFGNPINGLIVAGGNPVERRAWNLGMNTGFYTWWGADHTPFVLGSHTAAYMDTTIWYVRDYLSNLLCTTGFTYSRDARTEAACNPVLGIGEMTGSGISVYPNPSNGFITVQLPEVSGWSVQLLDVTGRILHQSNATGGKLSVNTSDMSTGSYVLHISNGKTQHNQLVYIQ